MKRKLEIIKKIIIKGLKILEIAAWMGFFHSLIAVMLIVITSWYEGYFITCTSVCGVENMTRNLIIILIVITSITIRGWSKIYNVIKK